MQAQGSTTQIIRFGTFELDLVQGTLTKLGYAFACRANLFKSLRSYWIVPG